MDKDKFNIQVDEETKEKQRYAIIYGHAKEITALRVSEELGIIISVEIGGICLIHRVEGRFIRKIDLKAYLSHGANVKCIQVHENGFIMFLSTKNDLIILR